MSQSISYATIYWWVFISYVAVSIYSHVTSCYEPTKYEGYGEYAITVLPLGCQIVTYKDQHNNVFSNYSINVVKCYFQGGCSYQYDSDVYVGIVPSMTDYMTQSQTFASDCNIYSCKHGSDDIILTCVFSAVLLMAAMFVSRVERQQRAQKQTPPPCKV